MRKYKLMTILMITMTLLFSGVSSSYAISTVESMNQEQKLENDLAEALELIFDKAVLKNNKEVIVGYDREIIETELKGNSMKEAIIEGLEVENLLISSEDVNIISEPQITLFAVACEWHGKRETMEFRAAENECIKEGLSSYFGIATSLTIIVDAIWASNFKQAAKLILKEFPKKVAGATLPGLVINLSVISVSCSTKMNKLFPGSSNCE